MATHRDSHGAPRGPGKVAAKKRKVRRLGDFLLLEELGRGGMGIVYRARQESLGREVALKVLPSFAGMEPSAVTRFRREAEAAARLSHPGIVPVYGVGEVEGIHYYAMELVEGPSLGTLLVELSGRSPGRFTGSLAEEAGIDQLYPALKDPPGSTAATARYACSCAALVADVANALSVAHTGKIIHRDLKPTNIMIHRTGRPVLLDFGLARDEMAVGLTRSGDAVGTPSYMAPEQACGEKDLDARVDIYGLGATLYEMLTLRPPFEGAHAGEIMRKILDEAPTPVRKLNPRVPVDLELIVNTCLAKDPDSRYPAIEALEMDLRAFLVGRTIEARPPSTRERAGRALRRNRKAILVAVATTVVAAAVGLTAGVVSNNRARQEGRQALAAARQQLLEQGNVVGTEQNFGRAAALLGDPDKVAVARRALAREAFEKLYPEQLPVLGEFFASIPTGERQGLEALYGRIEGRGRIHVHAEVADGAAAAPRIELRRYVGGDRGLAARWTPLPGDGEVRMGQYLLRATLEGHAPTVWRVVVRRDQEVDTAVPLWSRDRLGDRMAPLVGPGGGTPQAVSLTELTRGEYDGFLSRLHDPVLRGEMTPAGWDEQLAGDADLPVTGLSFRQARAAAAHLGFHLLHEPEYRLAATAGFELEYPWGNVADPARLVADPDNRNRPETVYSSTEGASPIGILHLLGNAAEMLAPGPEGVIGLAGGHYQSDPATLALSSPDLIQPLADPDTVNPYAGLRRAVFLPRPGGDEVHAMVTRRRAEILDSGGGAILHDWTVDEHGNLSYQITFTGAQMSSTAIRELPLVTTGFQQVGEPTVRDGHERALQVVRRGPAHGEAAKLLVQLIDAPRRGQSYRMYMSTALRPLGGLVGEAGGYVLRIPVKATGAFPVVHTVKLPPGCGVEPGGIDPPPTYRYQHDGGTYLVWEFLPDRGGVRTIPAVVRFRRDGTLCERWPDRRGVSRARQHLFDVLAHNDAKALSEVLDRSYLQTPSGADFDRMRRGALRGESLWSFEQPRMVDFTAVGSVVTVDLVVDWDTHVGEQALRMRDWPLRLQLLAGHDGSYRAVRLMPRGRPDLGAIGSDGSYVHDDLKVRLQPGNVPVSRTQDELVEMQVNYVHPLDEHVRLQVLGMRADASEPPEAVQVWLTAGAVVLRPGQRLSDTEYDVVGPPGSQLKGESQHWLFGDTGRWSRERWTFVTKGTRHFLVKAVSKGDTRNEAIQRFEANRGWFDQKCQTILIQ